MKINKIVFENIRTYTKEEIVFPEGAILLSGEVGAGKSTILLGIDFALFGLQKGSLTGDSLLRNGTNNGSVELHLTIEEKNIIIKRTLTSTGQDNGALTVDGNKQRLTPIELKQRILELLSYPLELLTKSKALFYRYTVYTPQEEMKYILYGDKDIRLDILRKVFGVDKYKKVIENAKIYVSFLKVQKKQFELMLSDFISKQNHQKNLFSQLENLNIKHKVMLPEKESLEIQQLELKKSLDATEREFHQKTQEKQELVHLNNRLDEKVTLKNMLKIELSKLNINQIILKPEDFDEKKLLDTLAKKEDLADQLQGYKQKLLELRLGMKNSDKIIQQIQSLNECPLCKQQVQINHKNSIINKEQDKISSHKIEETAVEINLSEFQEQHSLCINELQNIQEFKSDHALKKLQFQQYVNNTKRKEDIEAQTNQLNEEMGKINIRIIDLQNKQDLSNIENELSRKKDKLMQVEAKLKLIEMDIVRIVTQKESIEYLLKQVSEELEQRQKQKDILERLQSIHHWIESSFIKSIEMIEHQILLKIHSEFASLYKKWFATLMGSEELLTTLDEDFTPVVEQNGFVVEYPNLSGGEKTAVALSYRLALNQVINLLVVGLKTKDLIILDEPTDGFSNEQIDRLKLVLDELHVKQIILVSHEPKIGSFVDNVLYINKKDNISTVTSDYKP
ncbi:MAG: AAA family ATPase [Nanoarchaeota archaeon]